MTNMGTAFRLLAATAAILYFDTGCDRSAPNATKLTYTEACLAAEEAKEAAETTKALIAEVTKTMAELDAEKAPKNSGYYAIKSALEKHRAHLPRLVEEWKEAERVRDALKPE
jgi:hypothetical protein